MFPDNLMSAELRDSEWRNSASTDCLGKRWHSIDDYGHQPVRLMASCLMEASICNLLSASVLFNSGIITMYKALKGTGSHTAIVSLHGLKTLVVCESAMPCQHKSN